MDQSLLARWKQLLDDADRNFAADLKALYAKNSAGGVLRSGSTIKGSVEHYEARMTEAVDRCCQAISTRHSKGSVFWKFRFNELRKFLEHYFDAHSEHIDPVIKISGRDVDSSAGRAARDLLNACCKRLMQRADDYANGWTAADAKPWHEKNPVKYAILLVLAGAIASPVVTDVIKSLSTATPQAPKQAD